MARELGRLPEALAALRNEDQRSRRKEDSAHCSTGLRNTGDTAMLLGQLPRAIATAQQALAEAERGESDRQRMFSLALRAHALHLAGDTPAAQADFAAATALGDARLLDSGRGQRHARHHLDLGALSACRALIDHGLPISIRKGWNQEPAGWQALLSRLAQADLASAHAVADDGLRHARLCGYRLM